MKFCENTLSVYYYYYYYYCNCNWVITRWQWYKIG
jgi:hypothetical protein